MYVIFIIIYNGNKFKKIHQDNPNYVPLIKWCFDNRRLITQPCGDNDEEDITYDNGVYDLIFRVNAVAGKYFPPNASVEQFQFEKSIKNAIRILNNTKEPQKIKCIMLCIKLPLELREEILEFIYKDIICSLYLCLS